MSKKGKIFVISAPSGSGKTTLCKKVLRKIPGLVHSVSVTTRPKRAKEIEGRDYHFVSAEEFRRCIRREKFLEWTKTYGWYYGTPKGQVRELLKKGRDVLLSIDVKGAMNVKRLLSRDAVLIFIQPPSIMELKARLKKRNSDGKMEIEKRLSIAKKEISYASRYDYTVVNDAINSAARKLKAIIIAERSKTK